MITRIFAIAAALLLTSAVALADVECDFLSEDYFARKDTAKNVVACLERGYTLAIRDARVNGGGNTPLHLAAEHLEDPFLLTQMALLIAPVELQQDLILAVNNAGMTPFHVAVAKGRSTHFLANLARWGDPVNAAFDDDKSRFFGMRGTTALHLAMQDWRGSPEQVDRVLALLALGADPQIRNQDDKTPLDLVETDEYTASLLLDETAWREHVSNRLAVLEHAETKVPQDCLSQVSNDPSGIAANFVWACLDQSLSARSDPATFWNLAAGGGNTLHWLVGSSPAPNVLDAVLGVADKHDSLDAALSSETIGGDAAIHLASRFSDNPLTIVQLARWGADINRIARPQSNGFLEADTGDSPLHLAARREAPREATRAIAALLALGADIDIYDNNLKGNPDAGSVGLQAIDYMNLQKNVAALALISPGYSFCEKVDEYSGTATAALGLGGGLATASGGATIASTAAGVTTVMHSSGAAILTGSSGYIAGTLGTVATGAFAFLTAPATLTAAGAVVILTGGSVLYCSVNE